MTTPQDYGILHPVWRPHQLETLEQLESLPAESTAIVSAPTGSGKSSYAAGMGHTRRTIVLTETKALQEQYANIYGFSHLFGQQNYPCPARLSRCRDEKKCLHYTTCQYIRKKTEAQAAKKCALNYHLYLAARWPRATDCCLVLDECHQLPRIVIDNASVEISPVQRQLYNLPEFPQLTTKGSGGFLVEETTEGDAAGWLSMGGEQLARREHIMELRVDRDPDARSELDAVVELRQKVQATYDALIAAPQDWFIRSGRGGFFAKPLTARHHFTRMFSHPGGPTVLMSATIGSFEAFAAELGIKEHIDIAVPSQWKPEERPVYVFSDAPAIGQRAEPSAYEKQAELISGLIQECPPTWSGVIHCRSKDHASSLTERLANLGLAHRLWTPKGRGTNEQLHNWNSCRQTGKLAVTWSWWTGVDLANERICIVAKTPFGSLSDDYGRARMYYDSKFYHQEAAWALQQGCGRTRRGRPQDYDHDGQRNGLVAIVDANWHRVNNYFDTDFQQSITQW